MSDAEQFYEAIALVANAFPPRTCLIVGNIHSLNCAAGSTRGYDNNISSTAPRHKHSHTSSSEMPPQPGTIIRHEDEFTL